MRCLGGGEEFPDVLTGKDHARLVKVTEPGTEVVVPKVTEAQVSTCRVVQVEVVRSGAGGSLCYSESFREFDLWCLRHGVVVARARFPSCQCGGGKLGYGRGHPGHATWCPAR